MNSNATLKTTGTLSLTQGYFYNYYGGNTLEAQGNVTVSSNYHASNNMPLLFDGGNTQTFNLTGATDVFNASITVNKSGERWIWPRTWSWMPTART